MQPLTQRRHWHPYIRHLVFIVMATVLVTGALAAPLTQAALPGRSAPATSTPPKLAERLGHDYSGWVNTNETNLALGIGKQAGVKHLRLSARVAEWYTKGRPSPERFDSYVLAAHAQGFAAPMLLISYYDDDIGLITDYDWYQVGLQIAERFRPNSPWLVSQGISNWGITEYAVFNEPDVTNNWDGADGFPFAEYQNALKRFADGVHAVAPTLKAFPGGFAGPQYSKDWTLNGYLQAAAPLLNDSTLSGVMIHSYNAPLNNRLWHPQIQFDLLKKANGINADVEFYVDEFNNRWGGDASGRSFLTTLAAMVNVVGKSGDGAQSKAVFVHPFSMNFLESSRGFGLTVQKEPWIPSERAKALRLLTQLGGALTPVQFQPWNEGVMVLRGGGKKMWVWQNLPQYSTIYGPNATLTGVPADATRINVYAYNSSLDASLRTIATNGATSVQLSDLPEQQTLIFVADSENDGGVAGGVTGQSRWIYDPQALRIDLMGGEADVEPGFLGIDRWTYRLTNLGFGWESVSGITDVTRAQGTPLERTLHVGDRDRTFLIDLPRGPHTVKVWIGDTEDVLTNIEILAEGTSITTFPTIDRKIVEHTFTVDVTDGQLNLEFRDLDATGDRWAVAGLEALPSAVGCKGDDDDDGDSVDLANADGSTQVASANDDDDDDDDGCESD